MAKHRDLVNNEWAAGYQERVAILSEDDPREAWHGDYQFVTDVHDEIDCPFRETERLYMKVRSYGQNTR
jgi:hypothetical protein